MKKLLVLACAALLLVGCSKSVGQQVGELAQATVEKVKAADSFDQVQPAVQEFLDQVKDLLDKQDPAEADSEEVKAALQEANKTVGEAAVAKAQELGETLKLDPETLQPIVEEEGVLDKAKEVAGDAAKAVKDAAGNAVDAVKDAIGKGAKAVEKAVE